MRGCLKIWRGPVFEVLDNLTQRSFTMWTKPAAADLRFGFEVTMYIAAR